jgi:hypothetical protein
MILTSAVRAKADNVLSTHPSLATAIANAMRPYPEQVHALFLAKNRAPHSYLAAWMLFGTKRKRGRYCKYSAALSESSTKELGAWLVIRAMEKAENDATVECSPRAHCIHSSPSTI